MTSLSNVSARLVLTLTLAFGGSCSDSPAMVDRDGGLAPVSTPPADAAAPTAASRIRYLREAAKITSVEQALPGTFIPPFVDCREPVAGDTATRSDGLVCSNVAISGCTEPGKSFADYADCAVVRRQRPYGSAPPANVSQPDDARLNDPDYLRESAWAREQIEATGCSCCHDARVVPASQWDISLGDLWIDSLSDTGLALFAGFADSSVLGAYLAADNFGFDRTQTGIPTTDTERMRAFVLGELTRRGLSEAWARSVPPFGGPIYESSIKPPTACGVGEGVDRDGSIRFDGSTARYLYVLEEGSANPGVPPNLDLPAGTLFRLDVLSSDPPLVSGAVRYGETPDASFQVYPPDQPADPLRVGTRYQLVALRDVGLFAVNCLFEFGQPVRTAPAQTPPSASDGAVDPSTSADGGPLDDADTRDPPDAGACSLSGGDGDGFGAPCDDTVQHTDCPCHANYCSKSPFDTQGYCSVTGCKEDPSVCPAGWTCLDISQFAAGQPSVCVKP